MLIKALLYGLLLFAFIASIDQAHAAVKQLENAGVLVVILYVITVNVIYAWMNIKKYLQGFDDHIRDEYEEVHKVVAL